jgi:hypothetical protein
MSRSGENPVLGPVWRSREPPFDSSTLADRGQLSGWSCQVTLRVIAVSRLVNRLQFRDHAIEAELHGTVPFPAGVLTIELAAGDIALQQSATQGLLSPRQV